MNRSIAIPLLIASEVAFFGSMALWYFKVIPGAVFWPLVILAMVGSLVSIGPAMKKP